MSASFYTPGTVLGSEDAGANWKTKRPTLTLEDETKQGVWKGSKQSHICNLVRTQCLTLQKRNYITTSVCRLFLYFIHSLPSCFTYVQTVVHYFLRIELESLMTQCIFIVGPHFKTLVCFIPTKAFLNLDPSGS